MIRSLLKRLFDRSRYRVVSGFEYRLAGLASCCGAAWVMHHYETLFNWLLASGIVLFVMGFIKKHRSEKNGGCVEVPEKSVFVLCWSVFLASLIYFLAVVA